MNCKKAEQALSMAMDGELPEKQKQQLQAHLSDCAPCRQMEQELNACRVMLRGQIAQPEQTPEAAWADVRRAIRLQSPAKESVAAPMVFNWRIQAASVIVMLAVIGVGVLLLSRAGKQGADTASVVPQESTVSLGTQHTTDVEMVETSLADATPMVYEDAASGMTVIWVMTNGDKETKDADS
ncbi:MAG: hypothetical protein A2X46_18200 [Lentisphaerae bacterium GWF2_57_35]|nr:MAG: hypothetical protein A2X46_18200 [Lentisphaerae bacterium GWF2_57_35]